MLMLGLVGVLVAIALPTYHGVRERARTRQAGQEIGAMSAGIQAYWEDHRQFPDSLADVKMSGRTDPWGRPYVYYNIDENGRGGARKDHALNPLNSDFDLYSKGPDGETSKQISQKSSLDDVIRAGDGRFVGQAADF
jgi:general secretion pathway protein G